jgi:hypothetical protein
VKTSKPSGDSRYLSIDAMRGVAALALPFNLLYNPPHTNALQRVFPEPLRVVWEYTRNGAAIFTELYELMNAGTLDSPRPSFRDGAPTTQTVNSIGLPARHGEALPTTSGPRIVLSPVDAPGLVARLTPSVTPSRCSVSAARSSIS